MTSDSLTAVAMYVHYSDDPMDNRPIFIHQSEWQQRMLTRYGSEVCLLDATYNTTCYGLPLFVLSVPTNSGYVMAAVFLLADEQACSIVKALQIISERCPGWKPKYIMSDYSEAQISAIESVFPGVYDIHFVLEYAISCVVQPLCNHTFLRVSVVRSCEFKHVYANLRRIFFAQVLNSYFFTSNLLHVLFHSFWKSKICCITFVVDFF